MRNCLLRIISALACFVHFLSAPAFAAENSTHKYDALGRLIETTVANGPNNGTQTAVTYDSSGNRSNYTVTGSAASSAATIAISGSGNVIEGSPLIFTVTRGGNTTGVTTVQYATSDGTAIANSDYTAASGTLTFAAGETSKTVSVTTLDNSAFEGAETLTVTLSGASGGAMISTASAVGSILDYDIELSIAAPASAVEGSALTFEITRTGYTSDETYVNYATVAGTATAGSDYTAVSGALYFDSDQSIKTITVPTIDDSVSESTETLSVVLSNATGSATISTASATTALYDNDSNGPCELMALNGEGNDEFTATAQLQKSAFCSNAVVVGASVAYISGSGQYEVGTMYGGGTINPIDTYKALPIYPYYGSVLTGSPLVLRVTWYVVSGNATIIPNESILTIYSSN